MKTQIKGIKLASRIAIYIPGTDGVSEKSDNTVWIERAASLLSELFGGATATEAAGYWMSEAVGLVKEATTLIYSYCQSELLDVGMEKVVEFATRMKSELKQEAVSLEVDGSLYLI